MHIPLAITGVVVGKIALVVETAVEAVVETTADVVDETEGQVLTLYPLEPAITTWKPAQYWPSLVASAAVTSADQNEHLILVVEAGSVQFGPGSRIGLRSK